MKELTRATTHGIVHPLRDTHHTVTVYDERREAFVGKSLRKSGTLESPGVGEEIG